MLTDNRNTDPGSVGPLVCYDYALLPRDYGRLLVPGVRWSKGGTFLLNILSFVKWNCQEQV